MRIASRNCSSRSLSHGGVIFCSLSSTLSCASLFCQPRIPASQSSSAMATPLLLTPDVPSLSAHALSKFSGTWSMLALLPTSFHNWTLPRVASAVDSFTPHRCQGCPVTVMQMSHHGIAGSCKKLCFAFSSLSGAMCSLSALGACAPCSCSSRSQRLLVVGLSHDVLEVHLRFHRSRQLALVPTPFLICSSIQIRGGFGLCRPISPSSSCHKTPPRVVNVAHRSFLLFHNLPTPMMGPLT